MLGKNAWARNMVYFYKILFYKNALSSFVLIYLETNPEGFCFCMTAVGLEVWKGVEDQARLRFGCGGQVMNTRRCGQDFRFPWDLRWCPPALAGQRVAGCFFCSGFSELIWGWRGLGRWSGKKYKRNRT